MTLSKKRTGLIYMCICIVRREGKKEHGVQSRHQEVRVFLWVRNTQKPLFILFASSSLFLKHHQIMPKKNSKKKKEEEEETVVVVRINHEVASS